MTRLLLALLLLTACAKPAPVSAPIATATAITPGKGIIGPEAGPVDAPIINVDDSHGKGGESVQRASVPLPGTTFGDQYGAFSLHRAEDAVGIQPALAWPNKPRVARLASAVASPSPLDGSSEIPWRGLVVYDLNEPAFDAGDLATKAARTFLGCEVRAWILAGNAPKDAVGAVGERGGPQIHPSWRQKMAEMGLDFEVERDRWAFALWLAENSGWQNWWFCQHTAEGADGTSGDW